MSPRETQAPSDRGLYPDVPRDFGFGEDHALLRDSARRFLAERCPASEVRRLADDPMGHDPGLWKEMAELGWVGLVLPEAQGGAGLGALHLALLMEEMGRRVLPSPFFGVLLAGLALERAGDAEQQSRWLPPLASGERVGTLAFAEPDGSWQADTGTATAEPAEGGGFVLRGTKAFVPAAPSADLVVTPFRVGSGSGAGEMALFAVELPAAGVRVEAETNVDSTRRTGRVVFDGARVEAAARLQGGDPLAALRATFAWGQVALAAEMAGAGEALLGMTRDYAVERVQFDRPIGAFQAVKHPLVDMMVGVENARTLALAAAAALDAPETGIAQAEIAAAMAKAAAGDALDYAARKAIQLHGGYGFTWDCDAHFYFKRGLWARATLGDALHHRRHLAEALLGPPADPAGARGSAR